MTKGRPSTSGVDNAIRIAQERGCVMKIYYNLESVCNFLIRTPAHVIFVRICRTEKIIASIREIEMEYHKRIEELRLFPASAQILLELWVYSKNGTYRFFCLGKSGLSEIDRKGVPVTSPGPAASTT